MKRVPSRLALAILFFAGFVRLVACSDDGLGINGDGGLDQSVSDLSGGDQAVKPGAVDLAARDFAGTSCGSMTCGSTETCCVVPDVANQSVMQMCQASASCDDGGIPISCDGPEDCSGGTPSCCVDVSLGGMNVMGGAMCTASCPASATGGGGGGMLTTKLCHGAADCTNYVGNAPVIGQAPFDRCCGNPTLPVKFCAPGLITLVSNMVTCD